MFAGVRSEGAPCRGQCLWEGVSNSMLFITMSQTLWQVFYVLSSSPVNPRPRQLGHAAHYPRREVGGQRLWRFTALVPQTRALK